MEQNISEILKAIEQNNSSLRKLRKEEFAVFLKRKYEKSVFDYSEVLVASNYVDNFIKSKYSVKVKMYDIDDISLLQDIYVSMTQPQQHYFAFGGNRKPNPNRGVVMLCYIEFLQSQKLTTVAPQEGVELTGKDEGTVVEVQHKIYERDPQNRLACIDHYGWQCSACGLDLAKKYGEIGKNFIEVHHVVPLSEVKENHTVDPIKDLRPLCPNCHAMIHKIKPIITVEEFSKLISDGYKIINNMD